MTATLFALTIIFCDVFGESHYSSPSPPSIRGSRDVGLRPRRVAAGAATGGAAVQLLGQGLRRMQALGLGNDSNGALKLEGKQEIVPTET